MGQTMAWSHFSVTDDVRQASLLLDETVTSFRNRGFTRERAVALAAAALGISPRRARAILYGEVFAVMATEYRAMRRAFLEHLDDEARHLAERHAAVKARRAQMEMDL